MKTLLVALGALALSSATIGCGRPFDIKTPPAMVELHDQDPPYAYRAMTPDGVVVAVRVVDDDRKTSLDFWSHAIELRMKELAGYAYLGTKDVVSRDGTKGKELDFGHDENGKPYLYRVRVLLAQKRIFVIEAGGSKMQMDRYDASVDYTLDSVKVVCKGFLYPVFSSHTCNRW